MDHERFRDWFSRVDELTAAQRKEVAAVLSDPPGGAVSRGKARQIRSDYLRRPALPMGLGYVEG